MKKNLVIALTMVVVFAACKNDAKPFLGDYSYKTSGIVTIATDSTNFTYTLPNKIGQMTVEDLKSSGKDSLLLIMNEVGGGVSIIRAGVSGDSIRIVPYFRTMTLNTTSVQGVFNIKVSGVGQRYDESIVLNEVYDGTLDSDSLKATIKGTDIRTAAKKN